LNESWVIQQSLWEESPIKQSQLASKATASNNDFSLIL